MSARDFELQFMSLITRSLFFQYMTHDGQHIVVSHHDGILPDTSDLSSLAAAAETHDGMVSLQQRDHSIHIERACQLHGVKITQHG